ncbi:hypothetical protein FWD07_01570 [Candidatus Saccharibacteria bacterium]|nr:hypothetical protein [Candidatus Saccharibacteria bacterium]
MEVDPIAEQKGGIGVGAFVVSVVAIVLATAGLGLAIFAAVKDGSQIAKIDVIEGDLAALIERLEDERTAGVTTVTWANAPIDEDGVRYIFIDRWGVRFRFPEEMRSISWRFHGDELWVAGALAGESNTYAYNDVNRCRLSTMTRSLQNRMSRPGDGNFVDGMRVGDHFYYPWHPQHNCGYSNEESFASENQAASYIFHMLQSPRRMGESFLSETNEEGVSETE